MLERLREAREERKVSQGWVAKQLGRPQSYVSKVERGERRIDPPELVWFASLYGKPLEYFLWMTRDEIFKKAERDREEMQKFFDSPNPK